MEEAYVTRNAQYRRIHATLGGEDWGQRVAISSGGLPEAWMAVTSQGWCLMGFTAAYPSRHCLGACTLEIRRCALCGVCLGLLIISSLPKVLPSVHWVRLFLHSQGERGEGLASVLNQSEQLWRCARGCGHVPYFWPPWQHSLTRYSWILNITIIHV